jgi:hypothetical protein
MVMMSVPLRRGLDLLGSVGVETNHLFSRATTEDAGIMSLLQVRGFLNQLLVFRRPHSATYCSLQYRASRESLTQQALLRCLVAGVLHMKSIDIACHRAERSSCRPSKILQFTPSAMRVWTGYSQEDSSLP